MREKPFLKGHSMIINLFLAIAVFLAIGVAVNIIGSRITKI